MPSCFFYYQYQEMKEEQIQNLQGAGQIRIPNGQHKGFGKLSVLRTSYVHISVGPNQSEFIMGFGMLSLVAFSLTLFNSSRIEDETHQKVGLCLAVVTPVLYLVTALSDPGVYRPSSSEGVQNRYCHPCMHYMGQRVRHCNKCGVCIRDFDHHCPFMSKCVGRGNIRFFYAFMCCLSFYSLFLYYSLYLGFRTVLE